MYECYPFTHVMCTTCMPSVSGGQKRVSDPWTGVKSSCELLYGCWEPNPRPLPEQQVLLTPEPHPIPPPPRLLSFLPALGIELRVSSGLGKCPSYIHIFFLFKSYFCPGFFSTTSTAQLLSCVWDIRAKSKWLVLCSVFRSQ